jgi:hypothetical protein
MLRVSRGVLAAGSILLVAAHVAYWYWPREHTGSARAGTATAGLLIDGELPLRAWVAYPHQNLAFLVDAESGDNWRRGLSELLGAPPISLPRFGPFPLPPASSLAVAADDSGRRLVVVARIYPMIAVLARAAGVVARNPWLTGGSVGTVERPLEVAWDGRDWMLRTPGESWPHRAAGADAEAALARFAFDHALGPLPAAHYSLARNDFHLDLLASGSPAGGQSRPAAGALVHTERRPTGWRATAVLGPGAGSLRGLPSAVAFSQPGVEPSPLPFERLYRLLGIKRHEADLGAWRLVASDRLALDRGRELVPQVARLAREGAREGYAVDLEVVRSVARELEESLSDLPLSGVPEVRRWHGAALLLYELEAYDRWSLEVSGDGAAARSRLWSSK